MTRILIAGYQHETNTFAPSLADWAAFNSGENFPAFVQGATMQAQFTGMNIPIGGFIGVAQDEGWTLLPSAWAGATPSSYVTRDAFERISAAILEDVRTALATGLDGVYLDLHGAAVAEHAEDTEGELIDRIRALVGPQVPIVASLDLHANVTERMLRVADGLVSYRTYPHIDMAQTGARAAELMREHLRAGGKRPLQARRLPFLIPLNAQSTWMQPAQGVYEDLARIEADTGCMLSFCMGFPASDFPECGPVLWGHGGDVDRAVQQLYERVSDPVQWRASVLPATEAVAQALDLAAASDAPVVLADTQDNPGAGGDSNTTGMLHALLQAGAGRRWPGQVALGLLCDPQAAHLANEAGVGAQLELTLGKAVPTFTGQLSDPPVQVRAVVRALGPQECVFKGPMMPGAKVRTGLCACLEVDGVLVAVAASKIQMLDRELFRMVGIAPEQMKVVVVKSSNHFRADFAPIASHVLVAKAAGPMAADPGDLPWQKLSPQTRTRP
jgi:microcystin degradation protein MlrC